MKNLSKYSLLALQLLLALITYQLLRLFFLFGNLSQFVHDSASANLRAFVWGARFDLWAVAWSFLPIIILSLLPARAYAPRWFQRLKWVYIWAVQFWCIGLNVIDVELYKFTGRRLTPAWLRIQQDVQGHTLSMIQYYWWIALSGVIIWWLTGLLHKRICEITPAREKNWFQIWGLPILIIAITFLSLRGGWQLKPLSLAHAYTGGPAELGILRLNSTFTFFRSHSGAESVGLRFYKGQEDERNRILEPLQTIQSKHFGSLKGRNVVVIIVESLAAEYMGALNGGKGYTPFLDKLTGQAILFHNFFANGRRSIEAVPSIVCGLPSLMGEALLLSPFQDVNLKCLPQTLRELGYKSFFFHGAHNGSMHFDSFAARAGFDEYIGFNEYPNPADDDGSWGIFDEPFLQYVNQFLTQQNKPFFATVFTLTSHHPYPIPNQYLGQFPKGELEIHPSIGYVDMALQKFFSNAEKQAWYGNTVFLITGDHTQKSVNSRYQSAIGVYRVPLILFAPGAKISHVLANESFGQHIDIVPTVKDLLGINEPSSLLRFGQTLFSKDKGLAFNSTDSGYWLIKDRRLVEYNHSNHDFTFSTLNNLGDLEDRMSRKDADNAARGAEAALRAVVDYFNQGIVENKLFHE